MDKGWAGITGEASKGAEDVMKDWEEGLRSAGVARSWVPVFAADDYSPERLAERYMVSYVLIPECCITTEPMNMSRGLT